jgi:hypothetical protein
MNYLLWLFAQGLENEVPYGMEGAASSFFQRQNGTTSKN